MRLAPAVIAACAALALSCAACEGRGERSAETPALHPASPRLAIGSHERAAEKTEGFDGGGFADDDGASTTGDKKTFAYASTDGAAIAAEVTSVLAPAGGGSVHYEGYELVDDAQRLKSMASAAKERLQGVNPSHPALVGARRDGISAYALTADYASLMLNLANADANDDVGALNAAANQALAVEGSGQELADYYSALIAELQMWSRHHPEAAAEALKKYGD